MTRLQQIQHRFVEHVPAELEHGVLYVTVEYATAVHSCACGCAGRVVTPFTPTDWELIFDGATVSLYPSIGNWSFSCQSHYWIKRNRVQWAPRWSAAQIARARELTRAAEATTGIRAPQALPSSADSWLGRLLMRLRRFISAIRR